MKSKRKLKDRKNEKGTAMVIVLMIALLLLVATSGILLQASMQTANVTDMNAEQQAYNAAESGLQTALNVLRGHTPPNPLIDNMQPASHPNNRISFTKAMNLATSNNPSDTSNKPRLSRWMNYNYTSVGENNPDRVTIGQETYTPLTGNAYSLEIIDPDNPQKLISVKLTGSIDGGGSSKTFGIPGSSATITYNSTTHANVDVSIREASINLGNFTITTNGFGAFVPTDTRFEIKVEMTAPFKASKIIRGTIKAGFIGPNSINNVKFDFDSSIYILMGSVITIPDPITPNPPNVNGGRTDLNITITLSEPIRLLVRSTGYGPRGAKKTLEAMVQKNYFNGLSVPATLTLVGTTSNFLFDAGTSQNVTYSGEDIIPTDIMIPPIGTTNSNNLTSVINDVLCGKSCKANIIGTPANISEELPEWLKTASKLHSTLENLKSVAKASGSYYARGQVPGDLVAGNNAEGSGITFVDDNVKLKDAGGGILVVTGKLTLEGGFDFNGLIIVTGREGIDRLGGGNGTLQGNVVVAPYDTSNISAGYLSPKYDMSGGGISKIIYSSSSISNGLLAVSNVVVGVVEK